MIRVGGRIRFGSGVVVKDDASVLRFVVFVNIGRSYHSVEHFEIVPASMQSSKAAAALQTLAFQAFDLNDDTILNED
jgi:hypothetical protein